MRQGRHRQLGPLQKLLAVLGSVVLVVAALAVGQLLLDFRPGTDELHKPYLMSGERDVTVDVRTFDVKLVGARLAGAVKSGGLNHDTQGVWVIVKVRVAAHHEPITIGYAALVDKSGRAFRASDRVRQPLVDNARVLQPGIPVVGEIAFEIPADAVAGASLRLANKQFDRRMDAMSDIVLPAPDATWLDPAQAKATVTLAPIEVVKP